MYAIFVVGPAGTGKSTFCRTMIDYYLSIKKPVHLVNLDPAAVIPDKGFQPTIDIQSVYPLDEVMDEYELGPNGGLLKALDLLSKDEEWFSENLSGFNNETLFVDCPGQIEAYMHSRTMRRIIEQFQKNNYNVGAVYMIDAQYLIADYNKYVSACFSALSIMLQLEVPFLNIITKMDLVEEDTSEFEKFYYPDFSRFLYENEGREETLEEKQCDILDEFSIIQYIPFNGTDMESITNVQVLLDNLVQNEDISLDGPDYQDFHQQEEEDDDDELY
jgi:GPN-loop GTPase